MKDWFVKILISFVVTFIGAVPTLFFFGARSLLSPTGFLENFFVFGVGVYLLGALQILLFVMWLLSLVALWSMD